MIKYLYDYLFKKIKFSDDLMYKINFLNEINWCSRVGYRDTSIESPYQIRWCTPEEAGYYLDFYMNRDGIYCLVNFLSLASGIVSQYMSYYHNHLFNTEWNRVVDKINQYADYDKTTLAQEQFNNYFGTSLNLYLDNFIRVYMLTAYFYEIDKNLPKTIAFDVLDIYTKGHIVVGWYGKKPLNSKGSLMVF